MTDLPSRERPTVRILGTHGVPANYGGFETAAENVAKYLVRRGWRAIVYCQVKGSGPIVSDSWNGIDRVLIPISRDGWLGTSLFDLISVRHAARYPDVCLTFGYNTAIFNVIQRVKTVPNVINMDGIEWSRARWGFARQAILYTNERIACLVGNELIADHPEISSYLRKKASANKITTITYGADAVSSSAADVPESYGLTPGKYFTLIARPIPENSILEIVSGFCRRERPTELVILGDYRPEQDRYHGRVMDAVNDRVHFLGGIYEPAKVKALRYHGVGYIHGHTVGGTNPSLVEAMAAGNPIVAHDNPYNQWVAQDSALYFRTAGEVDEALTRLESEPGLAERLSDAARRRHASEFTWERVAGQYEELLFHALATRRRRSRQGRAFGRESKCR
jgi:glycosyltransferase involved in cell wall biosynthesis